MRLERTRTDDPVDRVRAAVDDGSELLESAVGGSMATAANNNNNSSSTATATATVPAGSGDGCESR